MNIQKFAQKGIVINSLHEILFIKYASGKYQGSKLAGKFALPGGKIEFGESPDISISKEIFDETGIKCIPGMPIYCWNWEYNRAEDRIQINAIARVCKYIGGALTAMKQESETVIEGCYWVPLREIATLTMVEDEAPAIDVFMKNSEYLLRSLDNQGI